MDIKAILARIRALGFKPEEATDGTGEPRNRVFDGTVPAPVAHALARAQAANRLTLIDFYADWCGSCKLLEGKVLADKSVREALERFEVVKVDTDRFVEPSRYFGVVGLPTLIVLDLDGREVYRREGWIEARELARELGQMVLSRGR